MKIKMGQSGLAEIGPPRKNNTVEGGAPATPFSWRVPIRMKAP